MVKSIPLTRDKFTIVDDKDYALVSTRKWYFQSMGYAVTTEPRPSRKKVLLHRFIMNADDGFEIDHINGDKLDNRRCNLRICTHSENARNVGKPKSAFHSKYKGVTWFARDSKWKSQIMFQKKNIHLGYFDNEKEAALAYNLASIRYHGRFANYNKAIAA